MVALLKRFVALEAPSADAEAVSKFVTAYRTELERWGVSAQEISGPNGPHLFAELAGAVSRSEWWDCGLREWAGKPTAAERRQEW